MKAFSRRPCRRVGGRRVKCVKRVPNETSDLMLRIFCFSFFAVNTLSQMITVSTAQFARETCGQEWPWMHRHCNLRSAKCNIPSETPKPPAWVLKHRKDPHRILLPDLQFFEPAQIQNPVPKRRIVGKQTAPIGHSESTPCVAASSSDKLPRTGVG